VTSQTAENVVSRKKENKTSILIRTFYFILFYFIFDGYGLCLCRKSACPARLGLTDLRFPLMWKDTDHFKNRGDYRRFAVFCLAKVGTEVMDTSLITPVDRSATDITFPDALVL
jgi:hypothetical protein